MTPSQSSNVVRWAAETFHTAMFINYEQVRKQASHITSLQKQTLVYCFVSGFFIHIEHICLLNIDY